MTTWYRTKRWENKISPVEVFKETEKFVTIGSGRTSKSSSYDSYFKTYQEAYNHIHTRLTIRIKSLEVSHASTERELLDFVREYKNEPMEVTDA